MEGVAHGVGAAGAGGHRAGAHAPEAGVDGDLARGHVADPHGDVEGRDPVPALFLALVMLDDLLLPFGFHSFQFSDRFFSVFTHIVSRISF